MPAADRPLRIATLRGPSAVGMVRMMDDAIRCGRPGIEVFDEPARLLGEIASGNPDLATLPAAMDGVLKGMGWRAVAIMAWGGLFVCGTDRSIRALGDLAGKTVCVMAGSTPPEMMLRRLLRKAVAGEEDKDLERNVRFDNSFSGHGELARAAMEGRCAVCILPEPFLSIALDANPGMDVLLDLSREWQAAEGSLPPVTTLYCRGTLVDDDAVRETVKALRLSCDWVKAHPDNAADLVAELGIFSDRKAIRASIGRCGFNVVNCLDGR